MKRNILIAVLTAFVIILGSVGIAEETAKSVAEGVKTRGRFHCPDRNAR